MVETESKLVELEKKLQAEIDERVYTIGCDVEVAIQEHEAGDWSQAPENELSEAYKIKERRNPPKKPLEFDEIEGEEGDPHEDELIVKEVGKVTL